MNRGHTPKDRKEQEQSTTKLIRGTLGSDFSAKLKSNRRHEFRDWRKEMGQGDASLRRHITKKMEMAKKMK